MQAPSRQTTSPSKEDTPSSPELPKEQLANAANEVTALRRRLLKVSASEGMYMKKAQFLSQEVEEMKAAICNKLPQACFVLRQKPETYCAC